VEQRPSGCPADQRSALHFSITSFYYKQCRASLDGTAEGGCSQVGGCGHFMNPQVNSLKRGATMTVVIKLVYGKTSTLLEGDAERKSEQRFSTEHRGQIC
jgi:beta-lactamase superfamily II metal-dependent hydrolase